MNHNHPIIANRTAFWVIGCLEAAWAPLVPYVKSAFGLDEETMGVLMLCSGLGSILALPVSGWLCVKFGAKRVVYISGFLMATALLVISLMVDPWLTGGMLMLFGACTITIDVAANLNGVAMETRTGRRLMSGFHGGYSIGTLIGAGAMSALFAFGVIPLWAVVACMVPVLAAMVTGCRDLLPKEELLQNDRTKEVKSNRLHIPPMVIVIGLVCFISWSAIFVSQERGVDMSVAGFFYTAFAVTMTAMRLLGDRIVEKIGQRRVVVYGALMIASGLFKVALIDNIFAAAVGFAFVGLGAANIIPQLISFAAGIQGMAVHNIISLINALGYSGLLLGPVIIGFVGKHYGLHMSFAGIAVLALIVAMVLSVILRNKQVTPQRTNKN